MIELIGLGLLWYVVSGAGFPFLGRSSGEKATTLEEQEEYVVRYMRQHSITLEQLANAWQRVPPDKEGAKSGGDKKDIVARVILTLGALLVLAGVGIYTSMFWGTMSSAMRIFITLGVGILLSLYSTIVMREGKYEKLVTPLIILAALMECGGWFVLLDEIFPSQHEMQKAVLFCFGVMAVQQAAMFHLFRRNWLALTAIAFAYGAMQAALYLLWVPQEYIALLLGGSLVVLASSLLPTRQHVLSPVIFFAGGFWFNGGIYMVAQQYLDVRTVTMLAGTSFSLLAYGMQRIKYERLAGAGYLLGSGVFYVGLFDWLHASFLEPLFLVVAIMLMYCAALLHSRALLVTSALAILGFLGYYSQRYFMHSMSWPIMLLVMGCVFLGVGSLVLRIKRRFDM